MLFDIFKWTSNWSIYSQMSTVRTTEVEMRQRLEREKWRNEEKGFWVLVWDIAIIAVRKNGVMAKARNSLQ